MVGELKSLEVRRRGGDGGKAISGQVSVDSSKHGVAGPEGMELERLQISGSRRVGCGSGALELGCDEAVELRKGGSAVAVLRTFDERSVVCGAEDGNVGLWDVVRCTRVGLVGAHRGPVNDVRVVDASAGLLASGGDDGFVKLWDIRSGKCIREIKAHSDAVNQLAAVRGEFVASAGVDGGMWVWSVATGERFAGFSLPTGPVWSVKAVGDTYLAAGALDGGIRVLDLPVKTTHNLRGHRGSVWQLEPIENTMVASACADGDVRVWNVITRKQVCHLRGHTNSVESLNYFGNNILASGSFDCSARLWNIKTGKMAAPALTGHGNFVRCCTEYLGYIVTSSNDGTIRLWSKHGTHLMTLRGTEAVEALAIAGDAIVSGSLDGTIRVWRPQLE